MSTIERIQDLYKHMQWAEALIWQRVLQSPAAVSDAGMRERLHHLHMVQRAFSNMWRKVSHTPGAGRDLQLLELLPWGKEYHKTISEYVGSLDPELLGSEIVIPWSSMASEQLGRPAQPTTLEETMYQVIMHSTYHRGQIATKLKELGGDPPLTDYIIWLWYGKPDAQWPL